jgi:hypothetical protein
MQKIKTGWMEEQIRIIESKKSWIDLLILAYRLKIAGQYVASNIDELCSNIEAEFVIKAFLKD